MREYETLYISNPAQSDQQIAELNERVTGLITKHGGRLFFARGLGKKSLSYPIKKQTKGIYTCLDYAAGGKAVEEIERMMRFDETVLRYLTLVKKDEVDVEARAAEVVARGEDRPAGVAEKEEPTPAAGGEKSAESKDAEEGA